MYMYHGMLCCLHEVQRGHWVQRVLVHQEIPKTFQMSKNFQHEENSRKGVCIVLFHYYVDSCVCSLFIFNIMLLLTGGPGTPAMPPKPRCPLWPLSPVSPPSPLSPRAPAGP